MSTSRPDTARASSSAVSALFQYEKWLLMADKYAFSVGASCAEQAEAVVHQGLQARVMLAHSHRLSGTPTPDGLAGFTDHVALGHCWSSRVNLELTESEAEHPTCSTKSMRPAAVLPSSEPRPSVSRQKAVPGSSARALASTCQAEKQTVSPMPVSGAQRLGS